MNNSTVQKVPRDLGVAVVKDKVFLFSNLSGTFTNTFHLGVSTNGTSFKKHRKLPLMLDSKKTSVDTKNFRDFHISFTGKSYVLLFNQNGDNPSIASAQSKDSITWDTLTTIPELKGASMLVPEYQFEDKYVAYTGESDIFLATSSDLKTWTVDNEVLLHPRKNAFDKFPIEVGSIITTNRGILLLYFVKEYGRENEQYALGAALFDKKNPKKLLWRSDGPIWNQPEAWINKKVYPMGALKFKEKFLLYFGIEGESVTAVAFSNFDDVFNLTAATATSPVLKKHMDNPIISPVMHHAWESMSTFNPAAVYEDGKVHLLYRAQGEGSTSTLGYATSSDGVSIDERLKEPVYYPTQQFEQPVHAPYQPNKAFMSGGGWGGCEDPRLTKLGDTFHLTYVAYNGRDHPRVAISSIPVDDFLNRRWSKWAVPKIISPPGVVDKNACLFPEKVNGKYVMLHRIFPNILIDFLDDLDFEKGEYLKGEHKIKPRENSWDSRKAGAGPPPIKTKDGWLLIYHAVDDKDDRQYKIGAMLLDLDDPTQVLHRSTMPILHPSEWYENEGFKAGVAYPCGAVVIENVLYVYYGGADSYVCVAARDLNEFLEELKTSSPVHIIPTPTHHRVLTHI